MNYLIRTWHIELVHTYIPFLSVSFRSRLGRETVRFDDPPNQCPDAAIITSYANNVSSASKPLALHFREIPFAFIRNLDIRLRWPFAPTVFELGLWSM